MSNDFTKIIELDEITRHSEPSMQIVRPGEFNKLAHVKTASEALDYIKHVKPIPGKTIILMLAMTAGEYYGGNRNGDGWSEHPMQIGPTKITEDQVLPKHYKTFETMANVFKHHINKDPAKRIGDVMKAFYNWPMHRVELLLALDNKNAEDVVERIERDEFPAGSMGCRIPYDVCNICGNKAPNRSQYCDHARYELGRYRPNGKQIIVWNPSPRFFDISIVRRPADRIGFMMKKVAEHPYEVRSSAELGEYVTGLQDKMAIARKLSVMNKIINGDTVASKDDDGDLSVTKEYTKNVASPAAETLAPLGDDVIHSMIRQRPAEVFSTLTSMGIFLTTPEFLKFFVWKYAPGVKLPEDAIDRAIALQGSVFNILANNPPLIESIQNTSFLDISPENINNDLLEQLQPLVEKRSLFDPHLRSRLVDRTLQKSAELAPGQGYWDTLEVSDPGTGQRYKTTRGEKLRAEADIPSSMGMALHNIFGSGTLLSGAYRSLGGKPISRAQQNAYYSNAYGLQPRSMSGETVPLNASMVRLASVQLARDKQLCKQASLFEEYRNLDLASMYNASFDGVATWLGKLTCS